MKEAVEMLVLPIKTLLGHYIYDANRNEILAVSKDLFNYISEVQAGKVCHASYKSDQEFQLLQSCGYCCDSPLQDIAYPSIDLLKVKLERNIRMLTLQLTQSCNFRCDYCIYSGNSSYNRAHSHNSMSISTAKHAIEFFKMHSIDNSNPVVAFYGGEPLLRFNEIKLITQYAEQVFEGKHISFRITTNCSLLSEEMVKFFFDSGHEFYLLARFIYACKHQPKHKAICTFEHPSKSYTRWPMRTRGYASICVNSRSASSLRKGQRNNEGNVYRHIGFRI